MESQLNLAVSGKPRLPSCFQESWSCRVRSSKVRATVYSPETFARWEELHEAVLRRGAGALPKPGARGGDYAIQNSKLLFFFQTKILISWESIHGSPLNHFIPGLTMCDQISLLKWSLQCKGAPPHTLLLSNYPIFRG